MWVATEEWTGDGICKLSPLKKVDSDREEKWGQHAVLIQYGTWAVLMQS
jgi:hypothetical protein